MTKHSPNSQTAYNSKVLFVLATQLELNAVLESLACAPPACLSEGVPVSLSFCSQSAQTTGQTGGESGCKFGGKLGQALFLICGIGPVNAALNLGMALARLEAQNCKPELIINLGIAGSFDFKRLPLGAAVLATHEIWPEYGLRLDKDGEDKVDPQALKFPIAILPSFQTLFKVGFNGSDDNKLALTNPDLTIWDRIELLPEKDLLLLNLQVNLSFLSRIHKGVGITVAGVSASAKRAEQLKNEYRNVDQGVDRGLFENMEGFALALASLKNKIPFVELRTISNLTGSRNAEDWNIKQALVALAKITAAILINK